MVWVSRLALIAYLVGGWLLPAMHEHTHPVAAAGKSVCRGDCHFHADHHLAGDHDHGIGSPNNVDARDSGADDHRGLCHVCAAGSIAKTSALAFPACKTFDPPCSEAFEFDNVDSIGVQIVAASPRGPPKFV
jgi:hypothetical protein